MAEVHAPLPEARGSWAPCILYRPAHWWGSFSEMTFPRFPCFHRSHQSSATIHPFCCHAAPRLGSLHGRRQLVGAPGGGGRRGRRAGAAGPAHTAGRPAPRGDDRGCGAWCAGSPPPPSGQGRAAQGSPAWWSVLPKRWSGLPGLWSGLPKR